MAFQSKRKSTKKASYRAKKVFKKMSKYAKKSVMNKMVKYNEHGFRRHCDQLVYDINTGSDKRSLVFKLSDVRGYSEVAALYDRYMLTTVVVKFRIINNVYQLYYNNSSLTINPSNWFPKLWYKVDHDDSGLESIEDLKEAISTKCKILHPNYCIKVVIKPAITTEVFKTTSTVGYAPKWNQWLDMAETDIPHYGLKFCVDTNGYDPADSQPFKLEVERCYYFSCKDQR